ncbi:hypothetical protein LCGC14_2448930, partial [marine sediment metagenome]
PIFEPPISISQRPQANEQQAGLD